MNQSVAKQGLSGLGAFVLRGFRVVKRGIEGQEHGVAVELHSARRALAVGKPKRAVIGKRFHVRTLETGPTLRAFVGGSECLGLSSRAPAANRVHRINVCAAGTPIVGGVQRLLSTPELSA